MRPSSSIPLDVVRGVNGSLLFWTIWSLVCFGGQRINPTFTNIQISTLDRIHTRWDRVGNAIRVDKLTTLTKFEALFYVGEPMAKLEFIFAL